jgi:hypothetical protein
MAVDVLSATGAGKLRTSAGDARAEFGNAERSDWLATIGMKSLKNGEGSCAMNSLVKARPLWQPGVPTSKAQFIGVKPVGLRLLEDQWLPQRGLLFDESTLIILPVVLALYKRILSAGGAAMGETEVMGDAGMYPLCGVLAAEEFQSLVGRRSKWMGEPVAGEASDPRGVTGCRDGAPGQSILRQAVVATLAGVVTLILGDVAMPPLCGVLAGEKPQSLPGTRRRSKGLGGPATGVACPRGVTGCRDGAAGQTIVRQVVVATLAGVETLILEETDSEPMGEAAGGARVRPPETMGERADGEGDGTGPPWSTAAERGAGLALNARSGSINLFGWP